MNSKLDFKAIADAVLSRAESLVPSWLPAGQRDGHEWRCGSLGGERGRSLGVNLVTGVWADFSSDDDKGGDLISLYAAIFTNGNQAAAARELAGSLGLSTGPADPSTSGDSRGKPKAATTLYLVADIAGAGRRRPRTGRAYRARRL